MKTRILTALACLFLASAPYAADRLPGLPSKCTPTKTINCTVTAGPTGNVSVMTALPLGAPSATLAASVIYSPNGALNVLAFGADPQNGLADAAIPINRAAVAVCANNGYGGTVYIPPGRFHVFTPIVAPCPGVIYVGDNPGTGPGAVFHGSSLVADASHPGPVMRLDPADWSIGAAYLRGVAVQNLQFDLTAAPTIRALELKSISNPPLFRDLLVVGFPTGNAIFQGISSNATAQISEGVTWDNINIYGGIATAPQMIVQDSNETYIRNSKVLCSGQCATASGLLVRSGVGLSSTAAIGVDYVSFAGHGIGVDVEGPVSGPAFAPRWVWVTHSTFEAVNIGVKLNGTPATQTQYDVVRDNRFYSFYGTSPQAVLCDYCGGNTIEADLAAPSITLTANSINNMVNAPPSIVTNLGVKNVIFGWSSNSSGVLQVAPTVEVSSALNPDLHALDTRANVKTKIQSLASSAYIGTESAHAAVLITGNLARETYSATTSEVTNAGTAFVSLGAPVSGTRTWCTNCAVATPCTGVGTGAWAYRTAAAIWACPF